MGSESVRKYIRWRSLTDNGHRRREQMSPKDRAEYDALGFQTRPPMSAAEQAEAKRLYEETVRGLD